MILTAGRAALATALLVTLGVIGAITYLCAIGKIPGSDVLSVVILILAGLGITGAAHVGANAAKGGSGTP